MTNTVENLKGEFVRRKEDAKNEYLVLGFNRSTKKYELQSTEDISKFISVKKGTVLFIQ